MMCYPQHTAIYLAMTSFLVIVCNVPILPEPDQGNQMVRRSEEEHKRQETVIRENIQPPIQSVHYSQASPLRWEEKGCYLVGKNHFFIFYPQWEAIWSESDPIWCWSQTSQTTSRELLRWENNRTAESGGISIYNNKNNTRQKIKGSQANNKFSYDTYNDCFQFRALFTAMYQ